MEDVTIFHASCRWGYLEVHTSEVYADNIQAYAAGFLEGHATRDLITMHWTNTMAGYCTYPLSQFCQKLQNYLDENFAWIEKQIASSSSDPYWRHVELFLHQITGLIDGYHNDKMGIPHHFKPNVTNLLLLQISGDLEDLESAWPKEGKQHVLGSGHCSALIKLLPGFKDVYVAQDTWSGFNSMLRILKKYDFEFRTLHPKTPIIPGHAMTFSSYPGVLMSGDDFYTISSGLVSQETTIGNSNSTLWSKISPENSVLEGIRNMVANRLAHNASEWAQIFARFNSGTYNNQWMIVDYNKFTPGSPPHNGFLHVLEQIPGMIVHDDQTKHLINATYWSSYNTAFYPEIFNASGGPEQVAKYGDWFSYERTPRALIFKRDHSKVTDMESMTKLMRYNDFKNDPLSKCKCTPPYSAENAISARSDLNPINGTYPFGSLGHRLHGGTDMKMTSSELAPNLEFVAVSGPTFDDVPPFQWSTSDFANVTHVGLPDLWKFQPITHKWK
ncbi:hypothetical protein CAPTEDRAFT_183314 [Capitella teleta]|uniref:Phospholipase B-like n=1 Tax=Capitella teleta TaxID=283909 RepID=R7VB97_CAPTE|nr:hypothetical protein CAPTEDRAFT_183314 [Capitella teleta]|eukprot:ELU15812.1 hypothetical protein CAPTEDRAFT_183314 [Capitella teleta]